MFVGEAHALRQETAMEVQPAAEKPPRVVIVGGGFGGLAAAKRLGSTATRVTLLDRRNYHLFQPLLYQVATGVLSPANIASPLRGILCRHRNCEVLMAEVDDFDLASREVITRCGEKIPFDWLIVATGATHSYFGRDEWSAVAPGLKTVEDATEIRKRILFAFEAAELERDPVRRQALLTFVIVGGGPTGVELAGALSDIAHYTLRNDFRRINPAEARVILVEAAPYPLNVFAGDLPSKSAEALRKLDVEVRAATMVTGIEPGRVELKCGEQTETIQAETVIWAAGVKASPLARKLAEAAGVQVDRAGRVPVQPDLSLEGHSHVMVVGDMAVCMQHDKPLPGLAPVAMQAGQYAAQRILAALRGRALPPFQYHDRGTMAVIGRYRAVAQIGRRRFSGLSAWFLWVLIHIMQITQFRNRLLVFTQWAWTFFTRDRSARLITGNLAHNEATPAPVSK
jgi:NADH:ubiquinone reductase (H+-translocating)